MDVWLITPYINPIFDEMDEPCPKDSKTVSYMENRLVWDIFVMTFSNVMWCGLSEYLAKPWA